MWEGKEILACQWQEWSTAPPANVLGEQLQQQGRAEWAACLQRPTPTPACLAPPSPIYRNLRRGSGSPAKHTRKRAGGRAAQPTQAVDVGRQQLVERGFGDAQLAPRQAVCAKGQAAFDVRRLPQVALRRAAQAQVVYDGGEGTA